jgi:acyl-CoA thioester hydrolase
MNAFQRTYPVIWANLDPNRHVRHTAYNDFAAQVRLDFFKENGMDVDLMLELGIGPILFREDTRFLKEVHMNETITGTLEVSKLRKDGSKWSLIHHIIKENREVACKIEVDGAWMDLNKRKVTVPPTQLQQLLIEGPRSANFEWIPDKVV